MPMTETSLSNVSTANLTMAVEICGRAGTAFADWPWQTAFWGDVVDLFGETEANAMLETLEEMREAFFSIPCASQSESVVEEAINVSKAFQDRYPTAPDVLIELFERRYMFLNR